MQPPSNAVYRAVIQEKHVYRDGKVEIIVHRSRAYDKPGPAKAHITTRRRDYPVLFVNGWVEYSADWEVLDD